MTRSLVVVALFAAGCGQASAPALSLREECRLGAWLALHVAREAPPLKVPSPDKPDQGDACDECGGTGKLGDGTVFVKCGACDGTGRKPAKDFDDAATRDAFEGAELKKEAVERAAQEAKAKAAPVAPSPERYATPPRDGRTYRKVCRNGSCAWEPVP
jgi:hypothetical protein